MLVTAICILWGNEHMFQCKTMGWHPLKTVKNLIYADYKNYIYTAIIIYRRLMEKCRFSALIMIYLLSEVALF